MTFSLISEDINDLFVYTFGIFPLPSLFLFLPSGFPFMFVIIHLLSFFAICFYMGFYYLHVRGFSWMSEDSV